MTPRLKQLNENRSLLLVKIRTSRKTGGTTINSELLDIAPSKTLLGLGATAGVWGLNTEAIIPTVA